MTKPNTFSFDREYNGFSVHAFAKYIPEHDTWEVTTTSHFGVKDIRFTDDAWLEIQAMVDEALDQDAETYAKR